MRARTPAICLAYLTLDACPPPEMIYPEVVYSIELPNLARAKEFGGAEHAARCIDTSRDYFTKNPVTPTGR